MIRMDWVRMNGMDWIDGKGGILMEGWFGIE